MDDLEAWLEHVPAWEIVEALHKEGRCDLDPRVVAALRREYEALAAKKAGVLTPDEVWDALRDGGHQASLAAACGIEEEQKAGRWLTPTEGMVRARKPAKYRPLTFDPSRTYALTDALNRIVAKKGGREPVDSRGRIRARRHSMNALDVLREDRDKLQRQLRRVEAAIRALTAPSASAPREGKSKSKPRKLSPETRAKLRAAAKKRWAGHNKAAS